jgi:hypothetical protein
VTTYRPGARSGNRNRPRSSVRPLRVQHAAEDLVTLFQSEGHLALGGHEPHLEAVALGGGHQESERGPAGVPEELESPVLVGAQRVAQRPLPATDSAGDGSACGRIEHLTADRSPGGQDDLHPRPPGLRDGRRLAVFRKAEHVVADHHGDRSRREAQEDEATGVIHDAIAAKDEAFLARVPGQLQPHVRNRFPGLVPHDDLVFGAGTEDEIDALLGLALTSERFRERGEPNTESDELSSPKPYGVSAVSCAACRWTGLDIVVRALIVEDRTALPRVDERLDESARERSPVGVHDPAEEIEVPVGRGEIHGRRQCLISRVRGGSPGIRRTLDTGSRDAHGRVGSGRIERRPDADPGERRQQDESRRGHDHLLRGHESHSLHDRCRGTGGHGPVAEFRVPEQGQERERPGATTRVSWTRSSARSTFLTSFSASDLSDRA